MPVLFSFMLECSILSSLHAGSALLSVNFSSGNGRYHLLAVNEDFVASTHHSMLELLYRKPLVYVRMHCLRADAARDTSHRNKRMLDMFRT